MSGYSKLKILSIISIIIGIIFFCIGIVIVFKNFYTTTAKNQLVTTTTTKPSIYINKWINIPTYEHSNEVVHPKVLYFNNKINGYKYWMVSTPYSNLYDENPQITVSSDGIKWIEPQNIKNPVSGYPSKKFNGDYHSDPFFLYDKDHFELFYRKTKSYLNGKYKRNGYNYIYKQESDDGIKWKSKHLILDNNSGEQYMSPSVIKEDNLYKIWYVNSNGKVRYIESTNLINYTKPLSILIKDFTKKIWHGEIQKISNKYVFIFMIKYKLYYTESSDGINFQKPKIINTNLKDQVNKKYFIYKSSYIISEGYIKMYITYRLDGKWKMYYIQKPIEDFYEELNI